jgi:hypothetical protein
MVRSARFLERIAGDNGVLASSEVGRVRYVREHVLWYEGEQFQTPIVHRLPQSWIGCVRDLFSTSRNDTPERLPPKRSPSGSC